MQKKAIRIITKSGYNAHTNAIFKSTSILPFEKIIYLSAAMFMHSYEYGYAPKAFENVWLKNNDRNLMYGLRNNNDYIVPQPRLDVFKKSPLYYLPYLWNNLNDNKYQQNPFTFKIAIKNFLFSTIDADL